jgi:predicted transcriptional regulator
LNRRIWIMRKLQLSFEESLVVFKALANEQRLKIIKLLNKGPLNVNEISEKLNLPFSTTAVNVQKLQNAGLISTEIIPGQGSQKVNSQKYDQIIVELSEEEPTGLNSYITEIPIGEYTDCKVEPTCGMASENGFIGVHDNQRTFYEPERRHAQLLWFRSGYLEYRFPNRVPKAVSPKEIQFSAELCSEAPYYNKNWSSDITIWINHKEVGTWTSPGDFGGERGFHTPPWRKTSNTQYGLLTFWKINDHGAFLNGSKLSNITIKDLSIHSNPFISFQIGVKEGAINVGGLNLFGQKFGNYKQNLLMKVTY